MHPYSLSVIDINGRSTPAIVIDGQYYDLFAIAPEIVGDPETGLLGVLESWTTSATALEALAEKIAAGHDSTEALSTPSSSAFRRLVTYPSKMIFAGLNYYDHLRDDLGINDFDKAAVDPLLFLKHRGALVASGQTIDFPKQTNALDWEVELVVLFGAAGRHITADDAMRHVAGYAVGLDLSARDWQQSKRHLREFDLFAGKAFDDSSPVGTRFVPADQVDPTNLTIKLWVNEDLKQNSSTKQMIWSLPELIAFISRHMAIAPGDMLFSGSPAGVGLVTNTYLKPGDVVRAEITGLGEVVTTLAADVG